jgi:hypothetical protein
MVKDVYGGALILPLLGHHYQIPSRNHVADHYEKTNAQEIAYCSNLLSELFPDFKINCEDFTNNKFKKPIDIYLALKMLNSALVDSDHKDTSDFYSTYRSKSVSIQINQLQEIFDQYYNEFYKLNEINKETNYIQEEEFFENSMPNT